MAELTPYYHRVGLICPKCENPLTIVNFCFSRFGNVNLECLCVVCGTEQEWVKPMMELVCMAFESDKRMAEIKELEGLIKEGDDDGTSAAR